MCEKIIQKVPKNQFKQFIEYHGILSKQQSSFRKNHYCETTGNYGMVQKLLNVRRSCEAPMFIGFLNT